MVTVLHNHLGHNKWRQGNLYFFVCWTRVDPVVIDEVTHSAQHVAECWVTEVRVRWVGHRLLADVNIAAKSDFSVEQGHEIAPAVRHELVHHLPYLGNATIHVDPATASGEEHHRMANHEHDDLPTHSH